MRTLRTPNTLELSVANVGATSVNVDWNADAEEESYGVGLQFERDYELMIPAPTYQAVSDHAPDLLNKAQEKTADRYPDRPLPDDLRDKFEDSDGYHEWRSGFDPMMNFVWPVALAYKVDAETAAALIQEFAPVCTLVAFTDSDKIGEEYGIALTGGGMNLADELAIAYLCCGCVPPQGLLSQLPGVIGDHNLKACGAALRKAYRGAADLYKRRAVEMKRDSDRLFKKKPA